MHGLVFVTWEKYLAERFGSEMLNTYHKTVGPVPPPPLLTQRVYNDEDLLTGVAAASRITTLPVDTLLKEYGRYFILNGLTRHLCMYLLNQTKSGYDLLLAMHDAHEQMTHLPGGLTPPLFKYQLHPHDAHSLLLIYDSPRKLCTLLHGAIEGAAEYYGDQVAIAERRCMKRGDPTCIFEVRFFPSQQRREAPELTQRHLERQKFADFVLSILPTEGGLNLTELQNTLQRHGAGKAQCRPAVILLALNQLHHAGLVASTADQSGDDFAHRRYWRVPRS